MAPAEREILSQVLRPPRHQLQAEWHEGAPLEDPPQRDREHLRRGKASGSIVLRVNPSLSCGKSFGESTEGW